ncbi:hypothetical protein [Kordiimonas sp.]|uniref:hypothetical protein n=1 Tax=Kordiimonas sp. TaxID=1970157 RepID=UPI003A8FCE40
MSSKLILPRIRKVLRLLTFFAFVLPSWLAGPTVADEANDQAYDLDLYTSAIPPYVTKDAQGVLIGSLVPVVDSFIQSHGLTARATLLPWSAAFRRTVANPTSLLYPVDRTTAREDQFLWIKPLVTTNYYLYGLKDAVDPNVTLADVIASGALVSCTANSIQCEILRQNGVPDANILRIEGASISRRLTLMVAERNYYTVYDPAVFAYLTVSQRLPSDELIQLEKVGEMTSYLAASKDMPAELLRKLGQPAQH